ncbi:hypothetical protein D9615_001514 [Tricholomella constricta]|uniref:Uncharacterized protein n=1 Tax=Tricholomella constricta TaxID=117010 RepID=A0A8H5HKY2_9AGAR|nr:hypothetical protein D9615_001514 [Tricholomella constricta]
MSTPSSGQRSPSPPPFSDSSDSHDLPLDSSTYNDISEAELRELYDNEEIERFLRLFSAYVTEVRAPETPPNERGSSRLASNKLLTESSEVAGGPAHPTDDAPSIDSSDACAPLCQSSLPSLEEVVSLYLVPILPPPRLPPPPFTIGRLRLATQRLYLAVEPAYIPFLFNMLNLATWKDRKISLLYCVIFWILWYHNLLLPCLLLRIFYALLRRKILPYPTLTELREHRREISRATEFGEQISGRLSASSSFGLKEMWRIFKVFSKGTKNKVKVSTKATDDTSGVQQSDIPTLPAGLTVLDDSKDRQEARDMKRLGLHILNEIADIHERIKNIFTWRRPASSRVYGSAVFCLFLLTLLLPTKYLSKLTYFVGGVLFWHVTPVIVALPPSERCRLPPAFADVPTDADYAMELIAKRVAAGQDVKPPRANLNKDGTRHTRAQTADIHDPSLQRDNETQSEPKSQSVDWKKWGERAAIGKTWADDSKRLISGRKSSAILPPRSPLVPQFAVDIARPEQLMENHTYPAQHATGPGLITLTGTALLFTPLMSLDPKFVILLKTMRGVKKAGVLKGLQVHYISDNGEPGEREEKFRWVGGRDELFARLVGIDGRHWIKG